MPTELDQLLWRQCERSLEILPDLLQSLAWLVLIDTSIDVLALQRLTGRPCPESHTPERLANVDYDAHDLIIVLFLKHLTDRSQGEVEPGLVACLAVLESVVPATAGLVLRVFPFWSDAFLEKLVVGLLSEFGCRSDVVLGEISGLRFHSTEGDILT